MAAVLKGSETGEILVRGKPDESLLYEMIHDGLMPPEESKKKLTEAEVDTIRRWISGGANYAQHWSYLPPERPEWPDVKSKVWPRNANANAIDRFILHRLEQEGLEPSREADRRTLIRRLSFDLIGLPPAPEEIYMVIDLSL